MSIKPNTDPSKKELVLNRSSRKRAPLVAALACAMLLAAAVAVYLARQSNSMADSATPPAAAPHQAGEASYPLALFNDGKAHHFKHAAGGSTIRYFVVKSSDGVLRAAFDACDVCWPSGKGYTQKGDDMVCNNCGKHFASTQINVVKGGCNPAPLQRTIQGDRLVIRTADILEGQSYFNFKGRS